LVQRSTVIEQPLTVVRDGLLVKVVATSNHGRKRSVRIALANALFAAVFAGVLFYQGAHLLAMIFIGVSAVFIPCVVHLSAVLHPALAAGAVVCEYDLNTGRLSRLHDPAVPALAIRRIRHFEFLYGADQDSARACQVQAIGLGEEGHAVHLLWWSPFDQDRVAQQFAEAVGAEFDTVYVHQRDCPTRREWDRYVEDSNVGTYRLRAWTG